MDKYLIKGEKRLKGEVSISGSKNGSLALLAASLLASGKTTFQNVPDLKDVRTMLKMIETLGGKYKFEKNRLEVDTTVLKTVKAPYELVKTMRASIYVLGPLLAREGRAEVSFPGGCILGPRPINIHLESLEKLGADIKVEKGFIKASAKKLKGAEIFVNKASVGATVNILMTSVLAQGTTIVKNAALEPEVGDLIDLLSQMGAKIEGKDADTIYVHGVNKLNPAKNFSVSPDRIETAMFLILGALADSPIKIKNVIPEQVSALTDVLQEIGVDLDISDNSIQVNKVSKLNPVNIKTMVYPGFATDIQPLIAPLLTQIKGVSVIHETIFENRFAYVPELKRMGADIQLDDNVAVIKGPAMLEGTNVMASDIRSGAALVLAALIAKNETVVDRIYHIDRGYEGFENKLLKLGASIKRIKS